MGEVVYRALRHLRIPIPLGRPNPVDSMVSVGSAGIPQSRDAGNVSPNVRARTRWGLMDKGNRACDR